MKHPSTLVFASLAAAAILLGGCAVYPNNSPAYAYGADYAGYGGGYGDYGGYGYGYPPAPPPSVFLGFGGYSGRSYPDSYWGRGYRGDGNNGHRGSWNGHRGGGGGGGGAPQGPPPQTSGSGGAQGNGSGNPGAHGGNGGGRSNGGGGGGSRGRAQVITPNDGSRITNH